MPFVSCSGVQKGCNYQCGEIDYHVDLGNCWGALPVERSTFPFVNSRWLCTGENSIKTCHPNKPFDDFKVLGFLTSQIFRCNHGCWANEQIWPNSWGENSMVISTQTTCFGIARPDFVSKQVISCKEHPNWMPRFEIPKQCWTTMASNQGSSFQGMLERVQRYKPDLFSLPRVCLSVTSFTQLHLSLVQKYEQSPIFRDWGLGTHPTWHTFCMTPFSL